MSALVATLALVLSGLVITSPTAAAADCTPLTGADLSSGAPHLTGSVADGSDVCWTIGEPGGMQLYLGSMAEDVVVGVYSAPTEASPEGDRLCFVRDRDTCRLPGTGPVTVRVSTVSSSAIDFEVQVLRLASDSGCPAQSTAAFGESGDRVASASLGPNEAACWSYDLTAGLHAVNQDGVAWALYDAQGEPVCTEGGSRCAIPEDGSYVLLAKGTRWQADATPVDKAMTLVDLSSTQGCDAAADLSWTGDVVRVEDTSPVELHCRAVAAGSGDRIGHAANPLRGSSGGVASSIVDADGNTVCEAVTGVLGCELTGAPPYRLLVRKTSRSGGFQASVRSFEPGSGCAVVDPDPFGASPADDPLPASGCGQLVVDAEGPTPFIVRPGAAYDAEGNIACHSTRMANCTLTSGRYWVVTSYFPSNEGSTVHDLRSTDGCVEGDVGLSQREVELSEGTYDCTLLALPEGSVVAAAHSDDTADRDHAIMFVDGDGAKLCEEDRNFSLVTCELTGPTPYRAVVGGGPATHEKLAFLDLSRTDSCGAYPGGRLSPDARAEVALTSGRAISCLRVPAGEADAAEVFRFQRTQGVGEASLHVVKADGGTCSKFGDRGYKYCEEGPAGTGYTAVVVQQVDDGDNTYRLSRYGTSSGADGCRPVDSTVLGAPATKGGLQDFLDATCLRVTADPADRIWVDARDPGGKADMFVFAADGGYKCKTIYNPCVVTGATSYQLLLQTNAAPVDDVDVDAWTLETADGLTPECVRYQDYDTGFGPLEATLGADRTGACVVLEAAGSLDGYELDIENTEGGTAKPRAMLVQDGATGSVLPCDGWLPDGLQCHSLAYWREETTPLVVFPLSEGADRLPFRVSGTCIDTRDHPTSGCARIFKVFDATPLTARSGTTATVTVEGRKLRDTEARLVREGHDPVEAVTTSVDDRTPTFEFDLAGVEPGAWSVELVHPTDGTLTAPGDFVVDKGLMTSVEAPEVRGVNRVDRTVRAYEGTWSAEPDSFTYQWHVNGRDIDWATNRSLRLRPWMLNDEVTVTVTAHKDGYVTETADAAGVQVHRGAAPRNRVRPRVKGIKHVGHWVRATHGTWSKKPRRFSYHWYLNGRRLVHQNHRRLFLRRWMRGDRIRVKVVAHRPGCYNGRAWSYRYRVRR